ncbi:MAG: hypothetical protein AAF772_04720 [Acidobacteriota bacterium]
MSIESSESTARAAAPLRVEATTVRRILTRTGGYLDGVASHSLQPYRGCPLGRSLCGVGCYVQHNPWVTRGRRWGTFLEARANAAESYRATAAAERRWAHRRGMPFAIFMASSSEPFPPQERRYGVSAAVLAAMAEVPADARPDALIVQTHSPRVVDHVDRLRALADGGTRVRVHVSIEADRDALPGLPPAASPWRARLNAAARCRAAGLFTVVTVAPLLPIRDPDVFFAAIADAADAVVLDHFVEGDGSRDGGRTRRTALPDAIARVDPAAVDMGYRARMATIAARHLPGRVGVGAAGFAGRYAYDPTAVGSKDPIGEGS